MPPTEDALINELPDRRKPEPRQPGQRNSSSTNAKKLKCGRCSYITDRSYNLARHWHAFHRPMRRRDPHPCCEEGAALVTLHELQEHKRTVHADGYPCGGCGQNYSRLSHRARHIYEHGCPGMKGTHEVVAVITTADDDLPVHIYEGDSTADVIWAASVLEMMRNCVL